MFRITRTKIGSFAAYHLSSGRGDELLVLHLGGTVRELVLAPEAGGKALSLLARCEPAVIAEDPLFRGRLLFPFNDRIPGGRYRFAGEEHRLRINSSEDGSAIHGFLYRRVMECVLEDAGESGARLVLRDRLRPGDEPGYPFALSLRVEYELGRGRCAISFIVRNEGKGPAPFALGWHPYFSLGGRPADWMLEHGGELYVPVDEALMPRGGFAEIAGSPFDFRSGRAIGEGPLDVALGAPPEGSMRLSRPSGAALEIHADPFLFPFTQLYLPPDRDSIALEPISSPTDAFNRPELGLQVLAPDEERRGRITLRRER
ncbi:MAG: aldose 1-epimerase [Rectinemataceae bacterium]